MSSRYGGKIVTDGLILCLDAHDAKSYAGEPTTNLLLYPESINSGPTQESWSGTITQNAVIAPDGTLTATKIEATSGYVYEVKAINTNYNGVSFGVGDTITYSVWIKMLDGTQTASNGPYIWNYNNPTYGIVARDLSGLGPDWKLYKMTYTIQSHQTSFSMSYSASNGGVTGTYAIWHPQLEVKSYNTPYIETSRSATNGWVDRSGNSNSGTLTNMIGTEVTHYRDGQVIMPVANSYLEFDGTNDIVTISSPSFTTINTHSVCAWVNTDDVTGWRTIIDFDNDEWLLALNNKNFTTYDPTFYSGYYLTAGKWHHVCRTHESGGPVYLYLDGALVYTSTNVSVSKIFSKINIGAGLSVGSSTPNELWNGKIAQVQMYSRKLSTAEVLSNYNTTKSRFS